MEIFAITGTTIAAYVLVISSTFTSICYIPMCYMLYESYMDKATPPLFWLIFRCVAVWFRFELITVSMEYAVFSIFNAS